MNKKAIIIAVVAVVVALIAAWLLVLSYKSGSVFSPAGSGTVSSGTVVSNSSTVPAVIPTRSAAPDNVTVPNKGDTSVPSNVAVPQTEGSASPTSNAHYRSFNITIANGQFSPDTIVANVGDTINLEITANGQDYDFTQPDYGVTAKVPMNTTKQVQFGVTAGGKFLFYCSSCGGPAKGPTGNLIVTK